ncbi:hypothetical protein [Lentzea sp. NBRC 102530]|uniref:hypothetical protein n=1 Tax=Lentzea sp. NBRC 102530 TaxID=3032201 RepID=UPI0024A14EAB|nr:hypothetical protein [Lentzea sp. NBRC 102530]GLY54737.1 hypothetical protein Lesp01_83920 [Lentzea sp. NBRC 102530]
MSDIEQRLVTAARDGEWLVCAEDDDPVPADLIRDLLLGRHGDLDPAGVRLEGARIQGVLNLDRVKTSAGLAFSNCTIQKPIEARYASLPDLVFFGGQCAGIHADGLHVNGDLFLRNGVRFAGDHERGTIKLVDCRVDGDVDFRGVEITNTTGPALNAESLTVGGRVTLHQGSRLAGHSDRAAVSFNGARLASDLVVKATEITNDTGPALSIESATIGGRVRVRDGNRITSGGGAGAFLLGGTRVSGPVALADTEIISSCGPGLDASEVHIGGSLNLRSGTIITGHHKSGSLLVLDGRVDGIFEIIDTTVTNSDDIAVTLDRTQVGGSMAVFGQSRLSAGGDGCALSLSNVRVGGWFGCGESVVLEAKSESMNLRGMTVAGVVWLPHTGLCPDRGRGSTCDGTTRVRLSDFTYSSLSSMWHWEEWLHVIRCHTATYHASAYQRFAAVERAAGHDGTVRQILMAQQTDLRRRSPESLGGRLTRWFHWLWGVLAGYGYRARRTAAALALVLVAAGALGWWAGQVSTRPGHLVAERVATAPVGAGTPCSTVELVGLGLDRGLPLAMTGMRARCDLDTASRKGQAFTAAIWLVQLAVWGLATLALAGYTNLVRKPG